MLRFIYHKFSMPLGHVKLLGKNWFISKRRLLNYIKIRYFLGVIVI